MDEHLKGLDDAKRAIEELIQDMRRKVVRAALRDAARPMVKQAKVNAPVKTGLVRRRISVFTSRIKRGQRGEIGVYIRPKATKSNRGKKGDPFYYKFQEMGFHATGSAKRKAAPNARFISGKMFLGRAFESHSRDSAEIFSDAIKRRIDLANRRK